MVKWNDKIALMQGSSSFSDEEIKDLQSDLSISHEGFKQIIGIC